MAQPALGARDWVEPQRLRERKSTIADFVVASKSQIAHFLIKHCILPKFPRRGQFSTLLARLASAMILSPIFKKFIRNPAHCLLISRTFVGGRRGTRREALAGRARFWAVFPTTLCSFARTFATPPTRRTTILECAARFRDPAGSRVHSIPLMPVRV